MGSLRHGRGGTYVIFMVPIGVIFSHACARCFVPHPKYPSKTPTARPCKAKADDAFDAIVSESEAMVMKKETEVAMAMAQKETAQKEMEVAMAQKETEVAQAKMALLQVSWTKRIGTFWLPGVRCRLGTCWSAT